VRGRSTGRRGGAHFRTVLTLPWAAQRIELQVLIVVQMGAPGWISRARRWVLTTVGQEVRRLEVEP